MCSSFFKCSMYLARLARLSIVRAPLLTHVSFNHTHTHTLQTLTLSSSVRNRSVRSKKRVKLERKLQIRSLCLIRCCLPKRVRGKKMIERARTRLTFFNHPQLKHVVLYNIKRTLGTSLSALLTVLVCEFSPKSSCSFRRVFFLSV